MAVEAGLTKIQKSSVTWLVAGVIGLAVAGGINAKGIYDTIEANNKFAHDFAESQEKQWQEQKVQNVHNSITEQQQAVTNAEFRISIQELLERTKK